LVLDETINRHHSIDAFVHARQVRPDEVRGLWGSPDRQKKGRVFIALPLFEQHESD
jgi:hypothetical protein